MINRGPGAAEQSFRFRWHLNCTLGLKLATSLTGPGKRLWTRLATRLQLLRPATGSRWK